MNSACVYIVQGPTPPSQGEQLLRDCGIFSVGAMFAVRRSSPSPLQLA